MTMQFKKEEGIACSKCRALGLKINEQGVCYPCWRWWHGEQSVPEKNEVQWHPVANYQPNLTGLKLIGLLLISDAFTAAITLFIFLHWDRIVNFLTTHLR